MLDEYDSSSSEEEAETLTTILRRKLVRSKFDRTPHDFIPAGIVDCLVTETAVRFELRFGEPGIENNDDLVDFILKRARKAFATMVSANVKTQDLKKAMVWFKKNEIDDQNLPVVRRTEFWTRSWRWDFFQNQWRFFVPIFSTSDDSHDLEEAQILPFISKLSGSGRGSFGEVSQYVLHRKHMDPVSG